jgi:hypothetical protein
VRWVVRCGKRQMRPAFGSWTGGQMAGTTTIDGTLAGIAGGATVTGGTILGAGTVKGNLSVGGSGTAPTIRVGGSGVAITGTYTQLATGTITGFINGTTVENAVLKRNLFQTFGECGAQNGAQ